MYDRILFPTDGSDIATSVFTYALDIAARHDASVYVLHVADTTRDSITRLGREVIDVLEREGERIVEDLSARATENGVSVVTDVQQGVPHETIVDYSDAADIDLIVMPTHGRGGLHRFLLGSVTERVVNTASVPVLTVTPDGADSREFTYPNQNVLVPTDGSQGAEIALQEGIDLAEASGASLHLLYVIETASLGIDVRSAVAEGELTDRANDILDSARQRAQSGAVEDVTTSVAYGRPYQEITSYVESQDIDMVVLGTHGQTDFSRYTLGSVSAKLLRTSPVPVMTIRDGDGDT